ncbi:MAG: archease [Gammaproteobacteria bacterium]|nr:archease [Gammaproteobacteria bacterium]
MQTVASGGWDHFPHGADVGVRGVGPSVAAAFEQAAMAMTAAVTDLHEVAARERIHVECEAPQVDLLLVEWLNALVYEMATRRMLFARFEVDVEGSRLSGDAWGEPVDVSRHRPSVEVKGATYTALEVSRRADGQWVAQCVIDV